jgi:hypothetical protein
LLRPEPKSGTGFQPVIGSPDKAKVKSKKAKLSGVKLVERAPQKHFLKAAAMEDGCKN